jgi:DNA-binding NtrC family response regulator
VKRIVVIATDEQVRDAVRACFAGYEVQVVDDLASATALDASSPCELVFLDVDCLEPDPAWDHLEYRRALRPLWEALPSAQVVVMSTPARIRETVQAVKAGACNYLTYPLTPEEVALVRDSMHEAIRAQAETEALRDPFWQLDARDILKTQSAVMRAVFAKVRQVAPTRSTVLLTGETGTGKNLVAKLIHAHSNRRDRQFIGVHCGAIPETLLESELFGHERGAFTGAVRRKLGKFEIADRGTIFLDEVGTIGPAMQVKLLQVLQDRCFQRVGGEQGIEVDIRILAATNTDLQRAAEDGSYRTDLFYRLNVFPIELPPLRDRLDDLPLLVETFLERLNRLYAKEISEVHPLVLEAFHTYPWPGNVRELESLMERAYILETSALLGPESFPREIFALGHGAGRIPVDPKETLAVARRRAVDDVERLYLKEQLAQKGGRINATAEAAGITERQLHKLMARHGLRKEDFRKPRRRRG